MSIKESKKRVQITIPKEKYKELKKLAIDRETTISDLLMEASGVVLVVRK